MPHELLFQNYGERKQIYYKPEFLRLSLSTVIALSRHYLDQSLGNIVVYASRALFRTSDLIGLLCCFHILHLISDCNCYCFGFLILIGFIPGFYSSGLRHNVILSTKKDQIGNVKEIVRITMKLRLLNEPLKVKKPNHAA